jgi:tRNA A-37 threonylcarbamoyl transferase component Bud32
MEYFKSRLKGYHWDRVQYKRVRSVYALSRDGKIELYVKIYHPDSILQKLRNLIAPKTLREMRMLKELKRSGIPVPDAVEHLCRGTVSALVTRAVEPCSALSSLPEERQAGILLEVASTLLQKGFFYGDCHAGNIVLDGSGVPVLVDAYAVSSVGSASRTHVVSLFSQITTAFRVSDPVLRTHLEPLLPSPEVDHAVQAIQRRGLVSRIRLAARRTARTLREGSFSRHVGTDDYEAFLSKGHPVQLEAVLNGHAQNLAHGSNILKFQEKTQLSIVGDLCVKSYTRPKPFTSPYALRSWKGLMTLHYNGIPVAMPVGVVIRRDRSSVLITGMAPGRDLNRLMFHEFPAMPPAEKQEIARGLGRLLGIMHGYGIYHADLKTSNIRVLRNPLSFFLLDTDRVSQGVRIPREKRIRNMVQMNNSTPRHVSRGTRMAFLEAYAEITGDDPKRLFHEVWEMSSKSGIAYRTDQGDRSEAW